MDSNIEKIRLVRIDDHVNFEATGKYGGKMLLDGSPDIGGKGHGVSPMESLLMAAAGCSGIDVVLILKKMRLNYKTLHHDFILHGDLKSETVYQAVQLSVDTYCSVLKILAYTAKVSASFSINGGPIQPVEADPAKNQ